MNRADNKAYALTRRKMVRTQLAREGIQDLRVLKTMQQIPRHLFLPIETRHLAYLDQAAPIGHGQTISQPYVVAKMSELLALKGKERVLEIGTGSGYQTAILAALAAEVYSIERHAPLANSAKNLLESLGYHNIRFAMGDGSLGWSEFAPYDAILVTAASPQFPAALIKQLNDPGRLLAPVGSRELQQLRLLTKSNGHISIEEHTNVRFVPLLGKYGWEEKK